MNLAVDPPSHEQLTTSQSWCLTIARVFAIVAMIGLVVSPPVAHLGMLISTVAFLAAGSAAWRRLVWLFNHPLAWVIAAFLIWVALATLYSSALWDKRWSEVASWRKLIWLLTALVVFAGSTTWVRRALISWIVAMCAISVLAILMPYLLAALPKLSTYLQTKMSLQGNPHLIATNLLRNHQTQSLALALGVFIGAGVLAYRVRLGLPDTRNTILWLCTATLLILFALIVRTDGRSGYLLLITGIVVFSVYFVPRRWLLRGLFSGVLVLVCAYAFVPKVTDRVSLALMQAQEATSTTQEITKTNSAGLRVGFYKHSANVIAQAPVFGWGTGGFEGAYAREIDANPNTPYKVKIHDPHNQYMFIWAEQGLLGLALFLSILGCSLWLARSCATPALLITCVLGWMASSLFSSHFKTFAEGYLIATMIGLCLGLGSLQTQRSQRL